MTSTVSEKTAEQIKALYSELAKIGPTQDWEKILKVTKKILGLSVNDMKAFQAKIVCLIHLDRFDEALLSLKNNPEIESELVFEKAYCEYRQNKIQEAYNTIKSSSSSSSNSLRVNELLAQICYKLEKYQESHDLYRDIIKNTNDDFEVERQTNLSAVVAAMRMANPNGDNSASVKELNMSEFEKKTYELCYNSACISIGKGNFKEAREKLERAERMCTKFFEDDDDVESFEAEIAIIRIQLAFCLQKLNEKDEALKIYNVATKSKSGDASINAVAANNLVCLNKDQNIFDSKKRFKAATGPELEPKLNAAQKKTIAYNEILFSIITNQNDAANKLISQLESKFNGGSGEYRFSLLKAALLYKEKKFVEAEKYLKELLLKEDRSAGSQQQLKFYLLQVYLVQGKWTEAVDLIKKLDAYSKSYKLGLVSALVTLLNAGGLNDKKEMTNVFKNAIDHYSKVNVNSRELEILVRENSNFQIACGNLQNAAEMLEKMRAMKPKDFKILSKLIDIYSKLNSDKAKELSKDLPTLEDIIANSNLDIDSLESQFNLMTAKYSKMKIGGGAKSPESLSSKQQTAAAAAAAAKDLAEQKKKKKKKRKVKLPKNYDPNKPLDAERWLPLRERSYYKGRRNKKKNTVGKGTQGAVSSKDGGGATEPQSPKAESSRPMPAKQATSTKPKGNVKKKKGGRW